ncbi:MAG TPA: glycosyl hydrolase [Rhodothermales bacterium]|nr:glycosyl hydrolase [Rhodothermales bacterium]
MICLLLVGGCASSKTTLTGIRTADPEANLPTKALFHNLKRLAPEATMFGHHDDLAYGVTWRDEPGRSDVREASGSYPAVYGWDATWLFNRRQSDQPDPDGAAKLRTWILEGYGRGGVATMCWHMPNPVTLTHAWDTTRAVFALLPGGSHHDSYKARLDVLADFFKSLRTQVSGAAVPVIFRPFHEHSGSWFWWGRRHSSVDEFVSLWRFTVEYLRDVKGVDNLLYSYSTDVFDSKEDYLERYPGDEYIDVLGFDDYHSIKTLETSDVFSRRLRMIVEMARERDKVAALTETGVEAVPDSTWWTNVFLRGIEADSVGKGISFALVWRNAVDREGHFYAPYPGHPSVPDFVKFRNHPAILFEDELPDLYRLP